MTQSHLRCLEHVLTLQPVSLSDRSRRSGQQFLGSLNVLKRNCWKHTPNLDTHIFIHHRLCSVYSMNTSPITALSTTVDSLQTSISNLHSRTPNFTVQATSFAQQIQTATAECRKLETTFKSDNMALFSLNTISSALIDMAGVLSEKQKAFAKHDRKTTKIDSSSSIDDERIDSRKEKEEQVAQQALYYSTILEDRRDRINELYHKTVLVKELTEDMNYLLNQQTPLLQLAEDNAFHASELIRNGADELEQARKYSRFGRR
ncbi:hypothetical protein BLNAU_5283 [Blattamonas nauphoetae]|uniref:t-SNARE coiled-coil homology domain-containing protein n=1 Tax=Blattamonas nauphoetae TaxID=2049346 RepID=A0ABQ9Y7Z2_9EUKA|nr:hypothetical protein BLNAU_5283 [Blattamonas nauphoetae]